jgi:hypothetical protein
MSCSSATAIIGAARAARRPASAVASPHRPPSPPHRCSPSFPGWSGGSSSGTSDSEEPMSAGYDSSFSLAVAAGVYGQEAKRRQVRFAWVVGLKTNGLVNGGKKKKKLPWGIERGIQSEHVGQFFLYIAKNGNVSCGYCKYKFKSSLTRRNFHPEYLFTYHVFSTRVFICL